ncbi:hypothetical protein JCM33374_g1715 [Metschnikowia sp. JCM 33374]|nr:hypothetical protein JCM33374_g1715 [Metschnikowia sp. JCM 33374]
MDYTNISDPVDLLLQELNNDTLPEVPFHHNEDSPPSESPVKPLNYHTEKPLDSQKDMQAKIPSQADPRQYPQGQMKDFNSSSDTYVSEDHANNDNANQTTLTGNPDLLPGNGQEDEQTPFPSPSKSIMKSSTSNSPKKSVAFQPSRDTFHTYSHKETEYSPPSESATPINHSWCDVDQSEPSPDNTACPPVPPPHTSSTITGLLTSSKDVSSNEEESDYSRVESLKKAPNNYSNLSLNEKLNVFLSSSSQSNHDDLDDHLDKLEKASNNETDINIHRLSYHLEEHVPNSIENPLNSFANQSELYLNSAHSSQSSLQSLIDTNRQLPADTVETRSKGIQFNDGIKGFPDTIASSIIPMTGVDEDSISETSSVGSQFSFSHVKTEPKTEPDHSYDQSYNSTEKSILNLLNSASLIDLPKQKLQDDATSPHGIKQENTFDTASVPTNSQMSNRLKTESSEIKVKPEPKTDDAPMSESPNSSYNSETFMKKEHVNDLLDAQPQTNDQENGISEYTDGSKSMKKELDNVDLSSSNPIEKSPVKPEDDKVVCSQSQICDSHDIKLESPVSIKKEHNKNIDSSFSSSENDSDIPNSEYEYSFTRDGNDPFTEIHTFEVDEKAVVPGPVKLVRSADTTCSFPGTTESKDESKYSVTSKKQEPEKGTPSSDSRETVDQKFDFENEQATRHSNSTDSIESDVFQDSVDYSLKSLAPPRSPVKDSNLEPAPSKKLSTDENSLIKREHAVTSGTKMSSSHSGDFDNSILANSSNITPPSNMDLPGLTTDAGFLNDLSQKINAKSMSFEESLSAEHDAEKNTVNFLSIWHSQSLGNRNKKPIPAFYEVPSIEKYNTADLSQCDKYHIPPSLQPKKFTEVNLVSARVVSPSFEDFNVSGFLPELSQDSGIEGHFRNLVRNGTTIDGDRTSSSMNISKLMHRRSLDSSNLLAELEAKSARKTSTSGSSHRRRGSLNSDLNDITPTNTASISQPYQSLRKSKFHVPSFEIKRASSILSPKNQYNDIFQDGSFVEPTIKAPGMKTLPSMDRDDVKRIMQMKQAMSLEEYSGLKIVGASMLSAMQHEPKEKHEALQQQASIYCDSMTSNSTSVGAKFSEYPKSSNKSLLGSPRLPGFSESDEFSSTIVPSPSTTGPDSLSRMYGALSCDPHAIRDSGARGKTDEIPQTPVFDSTYQALRPPRTLKYSDKDTNKVVSPHQKTNKNRALPKTGPLMPVKDNNQYDPFRSSAASKVSASSSNVARNDSAISNKDAYQNSGDNSVKSSLKRETKSNKSSPIKINSPFKVVKQNGAVTGVIADKKREPINDLQNKKIRPGKTSTVSDPSNTMTDAATADVKPTEATKPEVKASANPVKVDERGKLFFRVVGLKNLNFPEIKGRDVAFNLTLDNGIHCIRTPNYQLGPKKVPIDKEFELSVSDSLEFILTLKATYTKAKPGLKEVKERKVVKSKNKLSRIFGSKEIITTTKFVPKETADPLERVLATDGSFARCYVDLEQYKSQIEGQACNYDLTCFNEWATYTHNGTKVVKKSYQIGQLEVKMLYVPRSEGYEILPTSIKSAYESLDDLKSERSLALEGYLHQEGGDCETWKRRWFKLLGTSLIAHSEFSHKTRAKINLAKVVEVIYVDKENMGQSSTNYRNFSDILLMDNSFKIRFANGEIIDFGAPSKREKSLWIRTIQEIVYRNKFRRQPWVKMMQQKNGDRRRSWVEM